MFQSFRQRAAPGRLAVVVQPLAGEGSIGHLSNERRVSKTINHWRWERLSPRPDQGRLNSQRDIVRDANLPLTVANASLLRTFGSVGRWVTKLSRGPAHLEWIHDGQTLWLLQIDFEFEQPDDGVDPNTWLRASDHRVSGVVPPGSPLELVDLSVGAAPSPWRKVENVRRFAAARLEPFPTLAAITGDKLVEALADGGAALEAGLESFAHGRVVCRTDCKTERVGRENLPRTATVTSSAAVDEMQSLLVQMAELGAPAADICFLTHKFIPARVGAWARADPASSEVRVDSLWGVPDGLQYLPHDTFDCDIRRGAVSAERLRYKPRFIQECIDGTWQDLPVKRSLGRSRSLSTADVISISTISHAIAAQVGKPLLIMWFCGIPAELGIGRNLPWFSMPPLSTATRQSVGLSPRWPRKILRTLDDVRDAFRSGVTKHVLVLDPEVALFRDENFLSEVIQLAKRDSSPVQLAGSSLAHAHYQLEKAGLSVVPADALGRPRARGRRSFDKLVRDDMPAQIADRGEVVVQSRINRSEMRHALTAKLLEEAQELLAATDPDDVKGELADLLEVVRALADVTGVAWAEVETAASDKRARRGGFGAGAVLVGTEWPVADRAVQRAPEQITLRSLGKVVVDERRGTVSYNALLAAPSKGVEIDLRGRRIILSLTRDGLVIRADVDTVSLPMQLTLPLEDGV
jgi:predicted house-cleaning noncanonical NTP pyrophosphatase (MazG superfamily)